MQHPFFLNVEWDAVATRKHSPPFKPNLKSPVDTKMFEKFDQRKDLPIDSFVNTSLSPQ